MKVLEYSRHTTLDQVTVNYFYAGTDTGLYAFAKKDGTGFALTEMDLPTLSQGVWRLITDLPGSITDIKTTGLTSNPNKNQSDFTFIITQEGLTSTLYRIPIKDTVAQTFATMYVLARKQE